MDVSEVGAIIKAYLKTKGFEILDDHDPDFIEKDDDLNVLAHFSIFVLLP